MTTMTTSAVPASGTAPHRNRVIAVTRLIFANRWTVLYMPTIILMSIFLLNIAIWLLVLGASDGHVSKNAFSYSGAIFYVFIYMMVLAIQAVSRTFPFALGFGVTRRNFALGAGLAFVILAVVFSVLMAILAMIEQATNGWGINAHFFAPNYYSTGGGLGQFAIYLFGLLFCLFLGAAASAVFVRWRAMGLTVFFILLAVVLVGGSALIVVAGWTRPVLDWFGTTGLIGSEAWSLVLTALFAVAGYLILRRATPKG